MTSGGSVRYRRLRAGWTLFALLTLLVSSAAPAQADVHVQGVGVTDTGAATASPGLSDTPQPQTMRLDFDAEGTAIFAPAVLPYVEWDCRHDEATEGDRDPADRDGFTLTSTEGETTGSGQGKLTGRCLGRSTLVTSEQLLITCPGFLLEMTYVRVGSVLQAAGSCLYSNYQVVVGDFTLTATLEPASDDGTAFAITELMFRFRA